MRSIAGLLLALILHSSILAADPLPSWNDTGAKKAIVDFVVRVTQQGSPEFIAPADRIAVFD
ncbi:MAG: haloacid dehalogenase-like hydrolase, partial [Pirellulaceae bacterium]|nr:haloacid dehalogenase-like hydrolase [Pirellulaceae bacterium]